MKMMFGGSFDPFTNAHKEIVDYILQNHLKNPDDVLYIVPNGDDYHFGNKQLTPFLLRKEMIAACIQSPKIHILDIENKMSFTGIYQTLRMLEHPVYIIGSDLLYSINNWKEPQILLEENQFLVLMRYGYDAMKAFELPLLSQFRDKFILTTKEIMNISSSKVRNLPITMIKEYVPAPVHELIAKYQLYQKG